MGALTGQDWFGNAFGQQQAFANAAYANAYQNIWVSGTTAGTITTDVYPLRAGTIISVGDPVAPAVKKPNQDWLDSRINEMCVKL